MTAAAEAVRLAAEADEHDRLADLAHMNMLSGAVEADLSEIDAARAKARGRRFRAAVAAAQAERDAEAQRQADLTAVAAAITAYAAGAAVEQAIEACLKEIRQQAERIGRLAQAHNDSVADLDRRVAALGVTQAPPGGARPGDGGIVRRGGGLGTGDVILLPFRNVDYVRHLAAVAANPFDQLSPETVPQVVTRHEATRPRYLLAGRGGAVTTWSGDLTASHASQVAQGDLTIFADERSIDEFMAGTFDAEAAKRRMEASQ